MPTEDYDARALALPLDSTPPDRTSTPLWSRRSSSFRRPESTRPSTFRQRIAHNLTQFNKLKEGLLARYNKLSTLQKILFTVGGITVGILGILFLVYNERIFHAMAPLAKKWRDVTGGWMILWALIFGVSFPPLIGYSSLLTIAGFVYGFPNG
jgi:hypothetical protein